MSHYWEMMFEQAGERPAPHGTQVGVGTVLILKLVEALRARKVDFDAARADAKAYDQAAWEENIRAASTPEEIDVDMDMLRDIDYLITNHTITRENAPVKKEVIVVT